MSWRMRIHTRAQTHIHTHTHAYIHEYKHTHIHTHAVIHIPYISTHTHNTYTHLTHTHTLNTHTRIHTASSYLHTDMRESTCILTSTNKWMASSDASSLSFTSTQMVKKSPAYRLPKRMCVCVCMFTYMYGCVCFLGAHTHTWYMYTHEEWKCIVGN
jgi:hypothetical protein